MLTRLVQPIAVFEGKRPLRAGSKVVHDGTEVGAITSGTSVPYTRFAGEGLTARPADTHELRPIGLALIASDLHYRTDRPVVVQVVDERGNAVDAELVEKNLWPAAPFARAYAGFVAPEGHAPVAPDEVDGLAAALAEDAAGNTRWRRAECVNLIPSEQCISPFVERLSVADPAARYNEHNRLLSLGPDAPEVRYYKGTRFIMEKEEELKAALATFFGCARVEPRAISGQMANDTVYDALKQFKNRRHGGRELLRETQKYIHTSLGKS